MPWSWPSPAVTLPSRWPACAQPSPSGPASAPQAGRWSGERALFARACALAMRARPLAQGRGCSFWGRRVSVLFAQWARRARTEPGQRSAGFVHVQDHGRRRSEQRDWIRCTTGRSRRAQDRIFRMCAMRTRTCAPANHARQARLRSGPGDRSMRRVRYCGCWRRACSRARGMRVRTWANSTPGAKVASCPSLGLFATFFLLQRCASHGRG
jgi:hypothetical protein